jgi:hypothetical protein
MHYSLDAVPEESFVPEQVAGNMAFPTEKKNY